MTLATAVKPSLSRKTEVQFTDYVLTMKEAAQLLSLSERTLWRLIAARQIFAIPLSTRRRGILASEISRYVGKFVEKSCVSNLQKAPPGES